MPTNVKHPQHREPKLTQREVAEYLNVTDRTVRNFVSRGLLPAYRVGGRVVRFDARDVEALLRPIPTVGGDQVAS